MRSRHCAAATVLLASSSLVSGQTDATTRKVPPALRDLTPATRELVLHKWSGELNVPDPVACTVDPRGRVYVSATTRRKVGDLDIREHTMWIPDDVALTSVAEKSAFFRRELAPGKMRVPRGSLRDHNKDGSIDWKDLTHHTERIYQLRDTNEDGTADRMTVFAEGFNTDVTGIAAGVLYHDGEDGQSVDSGRPLAAAFLRPARPFPAAHRELLGWASGVQIRAGHRVEREAARHVFAERISVG